MTTENSLPVFDVTIDVFDPQSFPSPSSEDRTIQAENIKSISTSKKMETGKDTATITLYNDNIDALTSLPLHARASVFVETAATGGTLQNVFDAYPFNIRGTKDNNTGEPSTITFDCYDFVFGQLDDRLTTNAFRGTRVFGTSDAIVDTIIDNTDNISLGGNYAKTDTQTIGWNFESTYRAVRETAQRSGAVLSSAEDVLFFDEPSAIPTKFTLQDNDIKHPVNYSESDDLLKNRVVVVGGQADRVDTQNTGQDDTVIVDDVNRETVTVTLAKNRISRIEVFSAQNSTTDNLRCRIQATDANGNAEAPADQTKDIVRDEVTATEVGSSTFSEFNFNEGNLPNEIAIIMDSSGTTGQAVGRDANDVLIYTIYYSYQIVASTEDLASQQEYLTTAVKEETNAQDLQTARQIARAELRKRNEPARTYSFEASRNLNASDTDRAHKLTTGDAVVVDDPTFNINNDRHVVVEKSQEIGTTLTTEIVLQDIDTLSI